LSHFDGTYWQLPLYQPAVQGSKKPFEWLGWLISSNRIFPAVSEKSAFARKKARANVFFTYERHIFKFEFLFYSSQIGDAHKNTVRQRHILKFDFNVILVNSRSTKKYSAPAQKHVTSVRTYVCIFFGARPFRKFADKNEIFGIVGRRSPLPKYYPRYEQAKISSHF